MRWQVKQQRFETCISRICPENFLYINLLIGETTGRERVKVAEMKSA
jgi:hypothetical protein